MAEEIQKIGYDTSRALCEAGAIPREPVLNTDDLELIISDEAGTTFYHFPSLERLDDTDTGSSGISLLGVDDSVFDNIVGSDGQSILESIDALFTVALSLVSTAKLSDISVNSLTTADQTFTLKDTTEFIVTDDLSQTIFSVAQDNVTLNGFGFLRLETSLESSAYITLYAPAESGSILIDTPHSTGQIQITSGSSIFLDAGSHLDLTGTNEIEINSTLLDVNTNNLNLDATNTHFLTSTSFGIGTGTTDSFVHVHKATAGAFSASADTVLTVENSDDNFISFLAPSTKNVGIRFNNTTCYMDLDKNTGQLDFYNGSGDLYIHTDSNDLLLASSNKIGISSGGTVELSGTGGCILADSMPLYLGYDADGGWRIIRSGTGLEFQRKESGVWVTKSTITA